ncbi:MAG: hypothetical protein KatS3mg001_332 [Candidatus Pacearchaeota archaeon]|nr:MAG: hypothetical protein KatS3mg001_332 [Candidatus Pacearchaeota archaeon]
MICEKCGFKSIYKKKFGIPLCEICYYFSPNDEKSFFNYVEEKIDYSVLETYRNKKPNPQKKGMFEKAKKGLVVSRAPLGYKIIEGKLIPSEKSKEVFDIFNEFVNENISLNKLAKKHNLSVNGLKKVLRNFTYIGKIKFNKQVFQGSHEPIVPIVLFNKAQDKLEKLNLK